MNRKNRSLVLTAGLLLAGGTASAQAHLWRVNEAFCMQHAQQCGCQMRRLPSLVEVLNCNTLSSGDRIRYECSTGNCVEPASIELSTSVSRVEVIAEPTRSVTLQGQGGKPVLHVGPTATGWTFDGFIFDGDFNSGGAVVVVAGSETTLRRSIIENGSGSSTGGYCLGVTGPRVNNRFAPVKNVTLESSEVRNCYDKTNRDKDVHCVHSFSGEELVIRDNKIWNCQGDGVQLEADYDDEDGCYTYGVDCAPGNWKDVEISGNVIESRADDTLAADWGATTGIGVRAGENAIDLKAGGGDVKIRGNVLRGYRSYDSDGGIGLGSGHPDNQGAAITISGPFVACPTNAPCVLIEGNDISDSSTGIAIGQAPSYDGIGSGMTGRIEIRRNVLHNLSARYDHTTDPTQKGAGLRIGRKVEGVTFRHNTLANLPGAPFYLDGQGLPDGGGTVQVECQGCEISDNVLSYAGYFGPAANNCNSAVWYQGNGLVIDRNLCAPAGDPRRECSSLSNTSVDAIGFAVPPDGVTNPGARPTVCGADAGMEPGIYDFAPGPLSPAIDRAGTAEYGGAAQCSADGIRSLNARHDTGAKEYCADRTMRVDVDPTGEAKVWVESAEWYRAFAEFVYAKGVYSNALTFADLNNGFCHDPAGTETCLVYTGRCKDLCGTHPNGEVDCSCLGNVERAFGMMSPRTTRHYFDVTLAIDWDSNGDFDQFRTPWSVHPQSQPNNPTYYRAVGFSRVSEVEVKQEWEDRDTDPDVGDRNDYIAAVRALACSAEGVDQAQKLQRGLECFNSEISCQACGNLPQEEVAVSAALTADSDDRAELPEMRSLMLHVTAWRSQENPAASPSEPRVAVCPVLVLKHTSMVTLTNYHGGAQNPCMQPPPKPEGVPACASSTTDLARISFGKMDTHRMSHADICASLPTRNDDLILNDSFVLEDAKTCGPVTLPSMKSLTFELKWDDLEDASHGSVHAALSLQDVESEIDRVDVSVFSDIATPRFMCPSGVNIGLDENTIIGAHEAKVSKRSFSNLKFGRRE